MSRQRITQRFNVAYPMAVGSPNELFSTIRRPTRYALHLAAQKQGSEAALARLLGVSQQAVNKWMRGEDTLPIRHWELVVRCAEAGEFI